MKILPLHKEISKGLLRTLGIISIITVLLFLLYKIRLVFVYLILALVLSLIGNPIVCFLREKCKLPKNLSVIFTLIFFLSLLLGSISMFYPLIASQVDNISKEGLAHIEKDINQLLYQIEQSLHSIGFSIDFTSTNILSNLLNKESVVKIANSFLNTFSSIGVGLMATFFITFFFMKDKSIFIYQFKKHLLPDNHTERIVQTLQKIEKLLSRYFLGLCIQMLIITVVAYILLLIIGVKTAIVIALICALLNVIPYIGPLAGNVIATTFTLLTFIGEDFTSVALPKALTVSISYIIIQFLDNNFLQPYIYSNSVKSHPLEIFLAILSFGMLGGVVGMIIAIPLYTSIKVILKEFFPENSIVKLFTKNL